MIMSRVDLNPGATQSVAQGMVQLNPYKYLFDSAEIGNTKRKKKLVVSA